MKNSVVEFNNCNFNYDDLSSNFFITAQEDSITRFHSCTFNNPSKLFSLDEGHTTMSDSLIVNPLHNFIDGYVKSAEIHNNKIQVNEAFYQQNGDKTFFVFQLILL